MKKIIKFVFNSVISYWSYFLISFLLIMILQTPMRLIFGAETKVEYLWKTVLMYAVMIEVCVVQLLFRASEQKLQYLKHIEGGAWSFGDSVIYTLKNKAFWANSIGFAIWPIILPKLFGVINLLYVSKDFLETFPKSILVLFTVDLPFLLLSLVAWVVIQHFWSIKRLHH